MTIRPGIDWGAPGVPPAGTAEAHTDAELAALVASDPAAAVVVTGGDLARTLGAPAAAGPTRRFPIDLLDVRIEATTHVAVAGVVARRPGPLGWWRGPLVAVMNVEFLGDWDVAPRAHPNDGRADVLVVDPAMSVRQRMQAWRRLRLGTHVPHPSIAVRRITSETVSFGRELAVWVDGERRGSARSITVTVVPDGAVVYA